LRPKNNKRHKKDIVSDDDSSGEDE